MGVRGATRKPRASKEPRKRLALEPQTLAGAAPVERSGTLVEGRRRAAAVSGKGGNLKKRTKLSIFSDCRSLYPCAHQGNRKKRRRREHRFPPPAELGRLGVGQLPEAALCLHRVNVVLPLQGCAYRYMYFRTIVLTTCEIADQVRNDGEALKAFKSVKAR